MRSTKFLVATSIAAELERTLLGGSGELISHLNSVFFSPTIGEPRSIQHIFKYSCIWFVQAQQANQDSQMACLLDRLGENKDELSSL